MHYILTYFGNSKRDGSGSPHNRMQQTELQASNQAVNSIVTSPSTRRQLERKKNVQDKLGSLSDVKEDPSGVSTDGDAEDERGLYDAINTRRKSQRVSTPRSCKTPNHDLQRKSVTKSPKPKIVDLKTPTSKKISSKPVSKTSTPQSILKTTSENREGRSQRRAASAVKIKTKTYQESPEKTDIESDGEGSDNYKPSDHSTSEDDNFSGISDREKSLDAKVKSKLRRDLKNNLNNDKKCERRKLGTPARKSLSTGTPTSCK